MAKFHVRQSDLRRAFRQRRQTAQDDKPNDSRVLLRAYAAECGVKLLLLRRRGLASTDMLAEDDLTHNLDKLLTDLGYAGDGFGSFRVEEPPPAPGAALRQVGCDQLHEVLRYGGLFERENRVRLLQRLDEVMQWVEENLS